MINTLRLSPTRMIRYRMGSEGVVTAYLARSGMPPGLLTSVVMQMTILKSVYGGVQ